jgi:hypothetical protein
LSPQMHKPTKQV